MEETALISHSDDDVPYPSLSHSQTHLDRLATLATLLGMEPAPVENCRVLALGCAGGGNIIPMAYTLPGSHFVGIDLSVHQIEAGRRVIEALGLTNIVLRQMDIRDIPADFGTFDYIIAHGVYSWVPAEVREKVLQVCEQHLAPQGVACVSYNTYPGWRMLSIVRDAMLFHIRNLTDPRERVTRAQEMLEFMTEFISPEDNPFGSFLHAYVKSIRGELKDSVEKDDEFLLHDELEAINEPLHFYEFMEQTAAHGLQYLIEAELPSVFPENIAAEVKEALAEVAADIIEVEQYLDFIRNRMFRRTLLCHDDVVVKRSLDPWRVMGLLITAEAEPVSDDPEIEGRTIEKFRGRDDATLSTDHPASKAAMLCLRESWPRALAFDELLQAARARAGTPFGRVADDPDEDAYVLATNLLRACGYSSNLVELYTYQPYFVTEIRESPVASPIARIQAQEDARVTTLWHARLRAGSFQRCLLPLLDGTHDRTALLREILELVDEGTLTPKQEDGAPIEDRATLQRLIIEEIEQTLRLFAQAPLLVD